MGMFTPDGQGMQYRHEVQPMFIAALYAVLTRSMICSCSSVSEFGKASAGRADVFLYMIFIIHAGKHHRDFGGGSIPSEAPIPPGSTVDRIP